MEKFYFELTDTYGGEANYCWADRVEVAAKSLRGALQKLSHYTGYNFRKTYDDRWDATKACVCAFLIEDEYSIDQYKFKTI